MPQQTFAGLSAVLGLDHDGRLHPTCLGESPARRDGRPIRLQPLMEHRDADTVLFGETALKLPGVDETATLLPSQIEAVELSGLLRQPGDEECVPQPAGGLGPVIRPPD